MTTKKSGTSKGTGKKSETHTESTVELNLGGIFKGLGNLVDVVGKLAETGENTRSQQGEFRVKGLGDQARGVYGFSIRTGLGGEGPTVEPFGNVRSGDEGLEVGDVREPLVDVFDEGDEIVITAELPGVAPKDIAVTIKKGILQIKTTGKRSYVKEVELPEQTNEDNFEQTYNNGFLELRLNKQKQ